MIKVTLYLKQGNIIGFESKGHAEYAEHGYDIVCSAVSILTHTVVNSIEAITKVVPSVKIDDAKGYLMCKTGEINNHDVHVIYKVLEQGIKDIAQEYGNYVELLYKEV